MKNDRATELAGTLAELDAAGAFDEPSLFEAPDPHRYARRLLWEDPAGRFVVVAITWSAGQSSPLHDHAGVWGAELVVDGVMRETAFRLSGRAGDRFRFARDRERLLANGDVGVVVPPLEYHEFGNAGPTVARTVHVYAGSLERASAYDCDGDGFWSARAMDVPYDA